MLLGGLFIAALALTTVALFTLRPEQLTPRGRVTRIRQLKVAALVSTMAGWAVVLIGTFSVDPLFHGGNDPPAHILESYSGTVRWVTWVMPGKENLGWMSAILVTAATAVVLTQAETLLLGKRTRSLLLIMLALALGFAALAGLLGALLAKVGPIV